MGTIGRRALDNMIYIKKLLTGLRITEFGLLQEFDYRIYEIYVYIFLLHREEIFRQGAGLDIRTSANA